MREDRIAVAIGAGAAATFALAIAVGFFLDASAARALALQVATHAFVGREATMLASLALGNPPILVGLAAAAADVAILGFGYAAVTGAGHGSVRRLSQRFAPRPPAATRARSAQRTERVGVLLLAIILWVPLLPGSALLAAVVGRAAGYRARFLLPVLAASAAAADVAYALLAGQAIARFAGPWLLAPVIVLVLGALLARAVRSRTHPATR